jgi:hypothetical protein
VLRDGARLGAESSLRRCQLPGCRASDRRDETIASSRHVRDVSAVLAQRLAQARDRHSEAAIADDNTRPGSRHQLTLTDDLASRVRKRDENIERTTADVDGLCVSQ